MPCVWGWREPSSSEGSWVWPCTPRPPHRRRASFRSISTRPCSRCRRPTLWTASSEPSASAPRRAANGPTVGDTRLSTWPAHVTKDPIALGPGLIGSLIDPNLAFVLFLVGLVGLIFEFMHPGLSIPGIVGLIALVLSLVMLDMLPVRLAGVILLLGGVAFLIAELHIGHGFAAIAGVIALTAGGLLL